MRMMASAAVPWLCSQGDGVTGSKCLHSLCQVLLTNRSSADTLGMWPHASHAMQSHTHCLTEGSLSQSNG